MYNVKLASVLKITVMQKRATKKLENKALYYKYGSGKKVKKGAKVFITPEGKYLSTTGKPLTLRKPCKKSTQSKNHTTNRVNKSK